MLKLRGHPSHLLARGLRLPRRDGGSETGPDLAPGRHLRSGNLPLKYRSLRAGRANPMKIWSSKSAWVAKHAAAKIAHLEFSDIQTIAVIKHGGMGDLVLTRPFFRTLRDWFPNATLTASAISHELNGIPHDLIDRLHVCVGKDQRPVSFRRKLQSYKELGPQDLLFDITTLNASFWITRVTPAKLKIGFQHRFHHRFLYDVAVPRSDYKLEAETFLEQLYTLGLKYDWPLDFGYPPSQGSPGRPFLLYFPTASEASKCWPANHFADLLRQLAETVPELDHLVMFGLQEWEQNVGEEIVKPLAGVNNVRPIRRALWEETQNLVHDARLVISNDTGIRNLAIAMGSPTLGIFTATMPFRYLPRFGRHEVLYDPMGGTPTVEAAFEGAMNLLRGME